MTAEPFLNAMDDLYGSAPRQGGSAGPLVRSLPGVAVPAGWHSGAADELGERTRMLTNTSTDFAEADDATKQRVDATGAAVADGKRQMGDIKDDYRTNRSRLAAAGGDPEVAARINELDRVRTQDGANTVRATQARLPMMPGGGMPMMPSGAGMPMMPSGGMPSMGAPMQAFSPLSQMLSGLTIPQQVTRPLSELADNTPTALTSTTNDDYGPAGSGPRGIRAAISKALDIMGITDSRARAHWASGLFTISARESNHNTEAVNNWDINARNGNPSEGAFQMIRTTFAAHHEPGTSTNLRDPVAQACAVINYVQDRYNVSPDGHDLAAKVQQADPTRSPRGY
ncbi:hypothetical protein FIV07_27755 (plasmid) [Mycobacterium sp. THAF192]|nr:hypothetical protein FIV07_27755 [Mycobacterium sp. THAF192]